MRIDDGLKLTTTTTFIQDYYIQSTSYNDSKSKVTLLNSLQKLLRTVILQIKLLIMVKNETAAGRNVDSDEKNRQ